MIKKIKKLGQYPNWWGAQWAPEHSKGTLQSQIWKIQK